MTKTKKNNTLTKTKVWIVLDKDDKIVGAHHGKKYIATMNSIFVDDGKVISGHILYRKPRKSIKKKS